MRYVYYFNQDITDESVQVVVDMISQFESVDLFVTTNGGSLWAMDMLIHAINQHPDINIYLSGYVASAGTLLLVDCTQPVYLHDNLEWLLLHQGDRPVEGEFRKNTIDRHIMYDQLKTINDTLAAKYKKLGLTTKEIKAFNNGEDVVLYKKDFNRLKIARIEK